MLPTLGPTSKCDLHLHTNRSDGKFTPTQLIERALDGGLDIISMTDHDLATSIPAGVHRRGDQSLFLIHGAEVTGVHEGREYHLLVYFPRDAPQSFMEFCSQQTEDRRQRYTQAVKNLNLDGLPSPEHLNASGIEALTRHHLAQGLVQAGHASSMNEAFKHFATRENVPTLNVSFVECIRFATACGGITSWAHPPVTDLKKHIQEFADAGLTGLEALRPGVGKVARKAYKKTAKRHQLLFTGGSDWHGWKDPNLGLFYVYQRDLEPFFQRLWTHAA